MMQQQTHVPGQQPDTSQKQRQRRPLVTIVLVLAIGVTLWILKSQGVLPNAWLTYLPWIVVGILGLVMVWAILWLLKDRGVLRGSWVQIVLWSIRLVGMLGVLGFCGLAISIGISTICYKSHGDCWTSADNRSAILFTIFIPMFAFVFGLLQVYLMVRQVNLMISPPKHPETDHTSSELPSPSGGDSSTGGSKPIDLSPPPVRSLLSIPPPTDLSTIQQREQMVTDISTRLVDQNTTALVLTGIGGAGKSTLAALVYRYEERQRESKKSPFLADPLWLTIDPTVTITELTSTLLEALGKPVPQVESLPTATGHGSLQCPQCSRCPASHRARSIRDATESLQWAGVARAPRHQRMA